MQVSGKVFGAAQEILPHKENHTLFPIISLADFTEEGALSLAPRSTVRETLAQVPPSLSGSQLVKVFGAWFLRNHDAPWQMVAPKTAAFEWFYLAQVREVYQQRYGLGKEGGRPITVDLPHHYRTVWSGLLPKGLMQTYDWPEVLAIRFGEFPPEGYRGRPLRMGDVISITANMDTFFYYLDPDGWQGVYACTV